MVDTAIVPIRLRRELFCGANRSSRAGVGASCRRPAGWGTDHAGWGKCKLHGGCTPAHGRAVALAQARQVATLFGVPRDDVDEISGLTEELQRSAGLIDVYEAMCAQLMPDEVVFGVLSTEETRPAIGDDGEDIAPTEVKTRSGAALHVWVKLLNEERDRFTRLCESMVKLNLATRQVEYTQSQVSAMVTMLLSPDLGLSEEQRRVAARMLRGLDAPVAIEGSVVA